VAFNASGSVLVMWSLEAVKREHDLDVPGLRKEKISITYYVNLLRRQ
jgi:hypothetical protein